MTSDNVRRLLTSFSQADSMGPLRRIFLADTLARMPDELLVDLFRTMIMELAFRVSDWDAEKETDPSDEVLSHAINEVLRLTKESLNGSGS